MCVSQLPAAGMYYGPAGDLVHCYDECQAMPGSRGTRGRCELTIPITWMCLFMAWFRGHCGLQGENIRKEFASYMYLRGRYLSTIHMGFQCFTGVQSVCA